MGYSQSSLSTGILGLILLKSLWLCQAIQSRNGSWHYLNTAPLEQIRLKTLHLPGRPPPSIYIHLSHFHYRRPPTVPSQIKPSLFLLSSVQDSFPSPLPLSFYPPPPRPLHLFLTPHPTPHSSRLLPSPLPMPFTRRGMGPHDRGCGCGCGCGPAGSGGSGFLSVFMFNTSSFTSSHCTRTLSSVLLFSRALLRLRLFLCGGVARVLKMGRNES